MNTSICRASALAAILVTSCLLMPGCQRAAPTSVPADNPCSDTFVPDNTLEEGRGNVATIERSGTPSFETIRGYFYALDEGVDPHLWSDYNSCTSEIASTDVLDFTGALGFFAQDALTDREIAALASLENLLKLELTYAAVDSISSLELLGPSKSLRCLCLRFSAAIPRLMQSMGAFNRLECIELHDAAANVRDHHVARLAYSSPVLSTLYLNQCWGVVGDFLGQFEKVGLTRLIINHIPPDTNTIEYHLSSAFYENCRVARIEELTLHQCSFQNGLDLGRVSTTPSLRRLVVEHPCEWPLIVPEELRFGTLLTEIHFVYCGLSDDDIARIVHHNSGIRVLDLSRNEKVTNIASAKGCNSLEVLDLGGTSVSPESCLTVLENAQVKYLVLSTEFRYSQSVEVLKLRFPETTITFE